MQLGTQAEVTSLVDKSSSRSSEDEANVTPAVLGALLIAQCFFGAWSVVTRAWISEGEGVAYSVFLTYRCVLGGLGLLILARFLEGAEWQAPRRLEAREVVGVAALLVLSSLTFLLAVGCVGSFLPALFETLTPVYVCVVCVFLRFEPVCRTKAAGVGFAVLGALLVVAREEMRRVTHGGFLEETVQRTHVAMLVIRHVSEQYMTRPTALTMGLAFATVHVGASGTYWMTKKYLLERSTPLHLSAYAYIVGSGIAFLIALIHTGSLEYSLWMPTIKNLYALGFSFCESLIGCGLTAWAMKRTKATMVAASMTLQPVFSSLFSRLVLSAPWQADHVAGMLLTTCGLLLVVWSQSVPEKGPPGAKSLAEVKRQVPRALP